MIAAGPVNENVHSPKFFCYGIFCSGNAFGVKNIGLQGNGLSPGLENFIRRGLSTLTEINQEVLFLRLNLPYPWQQ